MTIAELMRRMIGYPPDSEILVDVDGETFPIKDWSTNYPIQKAYPTGAFLIAVDLNEGSKLVLLNSAEVKMVEKERENG